MAGVPVGVVIMVGIGEMRVSVREMKKVPGGDLSRGQVDLVSADALLASRAGDAWLRLGRALMLLYTIRCHSTGPCAPK